MHITSISSWWMGPACGSTTRQPRLKKDPRRCMGRSRGGLTTKIHALVNATGLPLEFERTPGQDHDAPVCRDLLAGLQPGQSVLADKAYDADWIRDMIRAYPLNSHSHYP